MFRKDNEALEHAQTAAEAASLRKDRENKETRDKIKRDRDPDDTDLSGLL